MVREFTKAMGQPLDQPCGFDLGYDAKLESMRFRLIIEELNEFTDATDKENLLKEMADLLYVVYGYAATYGLPIDEAFKRVHESNMSKLGDDGKPLYREDGKVLKGPNYKPADLSKLV
jgi:predicted HAD superfamily Cof-like phosphohydrolase